MSRSCIVQRGLADTFKPDDVIKRVRYDVPCGAGMPVYRVYYESRLYDDDRTYDCVRCFFKGHETADFWERVGPVISSAPTEGGRYYAEWKVKSAIGQDISLDVVLDVAVQPRRTSANERYGLGVDGQLSFFEQ